MPPPASNTAGSHGETSLADWFALLGGALAWTVHLVGSYLIAEFGCVAELDQALFLRLSAVAWLLIGVSVLCACSALAAVLVARHRRKRLGAVSTDQSELDSRVYMNRLAVVTSIIFMLVIVVQSIPIVFYLGRC